METLLVIPDSADKMQALKAFLAALKISFRSIPVEQTSEAAIQDADLIQRIDDYESGKTMPLPLNLDELKSRLNA